MHWFWLLLLLPVALFVALVLLSFVWSIFVTHSERKRAITAKIAAGEDWCERCVDVNVLNVMDLEQVSDEGFGRVFRCPRCGRKYYFNEIAFGGGRVSEIKDESAKSPEG
ncbi:MAG TPA: hypothetical protein VEK08_25440 [Planctomycetota bacterium]|nr:hypothetical protein [Planctomycetota bacterium]